MSKFKELLILLVLTSLFLEESEALRFRRLKNRIVNVVRRVGSAIREAVKPICQSACPKVCPVVGSAVGLPPAVTGIGCHIGCSNLCKRSIPDFVMSDVQYRVQPMSKDFSHYDLNGDKLISPEEFSRAESLPLLEVYDIFKFADVDGDYMLDIDEFETAPFIFTNEMAARINGMIENRDRKDDTTPKMVQDFFNITSQTPSSNNTWDNASVV
ncbi:hypothetical protein CHS0354_029585 [Potamilus streckersoni]|uniref:EF-hand domain-containing protein n=1 Tax=Potamilus streckersoni TaxID=2493646 RepID=A0AAE0RTD8_9BIVA|nr:hypothetical protein CHS0354_029585 [Potamilus streckersoni]